MTAVAITHPEKVMFPDDGITKGELAAYYELVAPVMLPHLRGRPVTMERFHRGIGAKGFFQKNVEKGKPAWLETRRRPEEGRRRELSRRHGRARPRVARESELHHAARLDVARAASSFIPDVCVFDLDPLEDDPAALRDGDAAAARPARRARMPELGEDVGLEGISRRRPARRHAPTPVR